MRWLGLLDGHREIYCNMIGLDQNHNLAHLNQGLLVDQELENFLLSNQQ